jgi:type VI protein secretion system component VasK
MGMIQSTISKMGKIGSISSFVLAASIAFTGWIGHSATNVQQLNQNTETIKQLQEQVRGLQIEVEHSKVIDSELKDVKEQNVQTQNSVGRLADELHAWQREERTFHTTK